MSVETRELHTMFMPLCFKKWYLKKIVEDLERSTKLN